MNKDVVILMTMDLGLKICQFENMIKNSTQKHNVQMKLDLFGHLTTPLQIEFDTSIPIAYNMKKKESIE